MWLVGRDGWSYELWMLLVGDSAGRELYLLLNNAWFRSHLPEVPAGP